MTALDGVHFRECWERRIVVDVGGLAVPFIGRDDLVENKRASGRAQDLADVEALDSGDR